MKYNQIWTRVAVSISYDDNHYTTGTSNVIYLLLLITSPGDKADCINLLLALTPPGFLAGLSGIRVGRGIVHLSLTWCREALGFS